MTDLVRIREGRILGGVCTGLAQRFNQDITLVRILTAAVVAFVPGGIFAYLVAWLAMPEQGASTSGLDTLVSQAKQWNSSRQNAAPGQPRQTTDTFDLYNDQRN